jgi:hypothetical protein
MGIGLGIGINRSNYAQGIFGAYQSRVIADGGVTEAGGCVDAVSGLLLTASLLLIPSGYKGGKGYAQIPTNGNGDLTWTRASDAWRTNADGLIQRVPWNLLQQSETFENAIWSKTASSVSANTTTAPNGTLTADSLIEDSTNTLHIISQGVSFAGGIYTASVYVKPNGRNWVFINIAAAGSYGAYFDVANGVVGTIQANITSATMTSVGNGWYRCVITANTSATSPRIAIYTARANGTNSYQGDGTSGLFIWGAQLVEGSSAQTYFPTTDRLNVPRLSYMYGSCPALLLEPQRTNLVQNSGWVGGGTTPTNWALVVGSGTSTPTTSIKNTSVTAYRFQGTSQRQIFVQTISVTNGTSYTMSIYVESVTTASSIFNAILPSGTGTTTFYRNGVLANGSDTIIAGSYYTCVFVATATGTADFRFGLGCNGLATADYILSMPQVEVGAYATTFILSPTTASATRIADSFSRNNIFTNGLITSSGGTWFVELRGNIAYVRDSTGTFGIVTSSISSANGFVIKTLGGGTAQRLFIGKRVADVESLLYTTTTDTVKIAIKWNGSTADLFVNGTKQVSATSFTATNMEFLSGLGTDVPKFIQAMALYPSPLSDTDCTIITTL